MHTFIEDERLHRLSASWHDWLLRQLERGCTPASVLEAMAAGGIAPDTARDAVDAARAMRARRIPSSGDVVTSDRVLRVSLSIADPNVAVFENLLDDDECREMIETARGTLRRSSVVDVDGKSMVHDARTSDGTSMHTREHPIIARIERRIAEATGLPARNGEPIQVLRYEPGDNYRFHHDYFDVTRPGMAPVLARGGQRVATVLMYLNDVEQGGATVFPKLRLSVAPRRGTAIYFAFHDELHGADERLLHGATPVVRGEKWVATKWIRQRAYANEQAALAA